MVTTVLRIDADPVGQYPAGLSSEWEALADNVGAPPWMRPRWFEIWWRAFGAGGPFVLAARRGTELVGIAPMLDEKRAFRSPTNYHSPVFGFLALDQNAADDLAAAALRLSRRPVVMSFLDAAGPTQAALRDAARQRRRLSVTRTLELPPCVATDGAWTDYERQRDAKLLRDLRRRERRLAEAGRPSFSIHMGHFDLRPLMEDCFRTEAASWKGARGTAMSSQPATRSFYTELAEFAHERGELMLAFLRLEDRPIAVQLNLVSGGTVTVLKLGHDEAFDRFAPGKLLIRHVLAECFQGTTTCYDFSGHANPYKLEWTDTSRPLVETRTFVALPPGLAGWAWWRFGRPLARRVMGSTR